jgi:hypothetical protein
MVAGRFRSSEVRFGSMKVRQVARCSAELCPTTSTAYVLAELRRTDMHRLRTGRPDGDETRALRALTPAREHLVGARMELCK